MAKRRIVGIALAAAMLLSVASATSLGTFDGVSLSGWGESESVCTAGTTDFYDTSGTLIGDLLSLAGADVGYIELDGFDPEGDCTDVRPVVVTIGLDGLLATQETVLSRTELGTISGTSATGLLPVSSTDEINDLVNDDRVTEVRVAFCPENAMQCGVEP